MRTLLALAAMLALAAPAAAEAITIELEAHDVYFTLAGETEQNPTLTVAPGDEVTVRLTNVGIQPHNWEVPGLAGAQIACCLANNQTQEVTFTVPEDASGEMQYQCLPHAGQGMAGTFLVQSADGGDAGGDTGGDTGGNGGDTGADGGDTGGDRADNDTPAPSLLLVVGALAVALLARRK